MPKESKPYANPWERLNGAQKRQLLLENKQFVVWDGEGARQPGKRKPQNYVLFGYFDGKEHGYVKGENLTTHECLQHIIATGKAHPNTWHVGFAFSYDVDMILRNLSIRQFTYLKDRGHTRFDRYRIEHIPGKWFRVTEFGPTYPTIRNDKFSVTIFDIWGFFQSNFVKAVESYLGENAQGLDLVKEGKAKREGFTFEQFEFIEKYWRIENQLLWEVVNKLREYLYQVDLRISKWHGPGALASFAYSKRKIKEHKYDSTSEIYEASRYAYAGGRFERFHIGRYEGVYGCDINSAYPNAISQLPSLSEGEWRHVEYPKEITEFGVYRVRMRGAAIARNPSPLFHRDQAGNISYPHRVDGWYWSPEIKLLHLSNKVQIVEGWEYVGWKTRPFEFVRDVYNQRKEMKRSGAGAQMALKLLLNSLYGKMAQRAGWERTLSAPTWHQLEWAGWVTAYTRAQLFGIMSRIPYSKLIAVETDGIFTTASPSELGISDSKELGEWEINEYDEIIYLQSGLYAKRAGSHWSLKFRGLDSDSVSIEQIQNHTRALVAGESWAPLVGRTTRFVGYRNALFRQAQNRGPFAVHHRVWETETKEIDCGSIGKRVHSPKICNACKQGLNAYEMPHETIIKSRTILGDYQSHMHDIPWMDEKARAKWREFEDESDGLLIP